MGDLVDNGEDNTQWHQWIDAVEPNVHNIPVAPIMGNHETYTLDWKERFPYGYINRFAVPSNGIKKYERQFYTFDWGPVHFIVLNTQQKELENWEPTLNRDQLEWFQKDVSTTKQPWKVVLMHKDSLKYAFNPAVRSDNREEGFSDIGKLWMPVFDEYAIDVVLSGHLHTYRNRGHIYNFQRSEKGPLYILTGVSGNVRYDNLWAKHTLDMMVPPQPEVDNYVYVDGNDSQLTFTMYDSTGQILDRTTVHKK